MKFIATEKAPKAIGPYSQGVQAGRFLFLSGQIPINPENNKLIEGNFKEEVKQVLKNIEGILSSTGCRKEDVIKTTCFLKDMKLFSEFNEVYAEFFGEHKPARSTIEVSSLPKNVRVEIELIALIP